MNLVNASNNGLFVYESNAQSIDELGKEIHTSKANVILLEKSCPYASEWALTKLLMLFPKLVVIVVDEDSNWLHIYRREDILMTSSADLISAIRSA